MQSVVRTNTHRIEVETRKAGNNRATFDFSSFPSNATPQTYRLSRTKGCSLCYSGRYDYYLTFTLQLHVTCICVRLPKNYKNMSTFNHSPTPNPIGNSMNTTFILIQCEKLHPLYFMVTENFHCQIKYNSHKFCDLRIIIKQTDAIC